MCRRGGAQLFLTILGDQECGRYEPLGNVRHLKYLRFKGGLYFSHIKNDKSPESFALSFIKSLSIGVDLMGLEGPFDPCLMRKILFEFLI